jgi:hypothetical protein
MSGDAAVTPIAVMNSRRLIASPEPVASQWLNLLAHSKAAADVADGSKTDLLAVKSSFRFALESGPLY